MWARLSHFAGARHAEGIHGFQGTYDTIRLVISSHLSSWVDNSNNHCHAAWSSSMVQCGQQAPHQSGSWKGEGLGRGWRGQQGKGTSPGSRRT